MTLHRSSPDTIQAWRERSKPLGRGTGLNRSGFTVIRGGKDGAAPVVQFPAPKPSPPTGFPPAVKLAIRKRAGGGDPENACCEACARWLGLHGGQCQHRAARRMGGTSLAVINSAANGVLLCGTPFELCHGLCEKRDPRMGAEGFWLRYGEDPLETPIMLHSGHGAGVTVWLGMDGQYKFGPPGGSAA